MAQSIHALLDRAVETLGEDAIRLALGSLADTGPAGGTVKRPGGRNPATEKTRFGNAPEAWIGLELFAWRQGLRVRGNRYMPGGRSGRPCKSFDTRWLVMPGRISVPNPRLVRAVKRITDEVWPVRERSGKFWNTTHYLAPQPAIDRAMSELGMDKLCAATPRAAAVEEVAA